MRTRGRRPRAGGYFPLPFYEYGTNRAGAQRRAFIERYRLDKKNPHAEVSEPVKPIVFYIARELELLQRQSFSYFAHETAACARCKTPEDVTSTATLVATEYVVIVCTRYVNLKVDRAEAQAKQDSDRALELVLKQTDKLLAKIDELWARVEMLETEEARRLRLVG